MDQSSSLQDHEWNFITVIILSIWICLVNIWWCHFLLSSLISAVDYLRDYLMERQYFVVLLSVVRNFFATLEVPTYLTPWVLFLRNCVISALRSLKEGHVYQDFLKVIHSFFATLEETTYYFEFGTLYTNGNYVGYGPITMGIFIVIQMVFTSKWSYKGPAKDGSKAALANPIHTWREFLQGEMNVYRLSYAVLITFLQTVAGFAAFWFYPVIVPIIATDEHYKKIRGMEAWECTLTSTLTVPWYWGGPWEALVCMLDVFLSLITMKKVVERISSKEWIHANPRVFCGIKWFYLLASSSTIAALIVFFTPYTGAYFNPAMATGHLCWCYFRPDNNSILQNIATLSFVYWLGPIFGTLVAVAAKERAKLLAWVVEYGDDEEMEYDDDEEMEYDDDEEMEYDDDEEEIRSEHVVGGHTAVHRIENERIDDNEPTNLNGDDQLDGDEQAGENRQQSGNGPDNRNRQQEQADGNTADDESGSDYEDWSQVRNPSQCLNPSQLSSQNLSHDGYRSRGGNTSLNVIAPQNPIRNFFQTLLDSDIIANAIRLCNIRNLFYLSLGLGIVFIYLQSYL